jgi:hypothetical protein
VSVYVLDEYEIKHRVARTNKRDGKIGCRKRGKNKDIKRARERMEASEERG